jgi:TRAP-type C4-dicarboxylate transport system substrate-binding protein
MADIGYLLSAYFPSEYSHTNLLAEAAMQLQLFGDEIEGKEGTAYIGALAEYIFFQCEDCNDEFQAQNQVFTGIASSSNYMLNCSEPVTTIEDLEGKRLRLSGSQWSRWAQRFDASPVTLSGNETFEALDQGVVDCAVISAPDLENLGIIEATTDITVDVPGGVFAGAPITNTNRDTWQSLTDKQREAMLHAGAYISAEIPWVYHQREAAVLERARDELGINIHTASKELQEATRDFVLEDVEGIARFYEKSYGVENGAEMLKEFRPVLEKWVGLVKDIETKEELGELYWQEVFSKVDPSSHGM